jgi:DNA mismatch repair protein MSH2
MARNPEDEGCRLLGVSLQHNQLSLGFIDTGLKHLQAIKWTDDSAFSNLESVLLQMSPDKVYCWMEDSAPALVELVQLSDITCEVFGRLPRSQGQDVVKVLLTKEDAHLFEYAADSICRGILELLVKDLNLEDPGSYRWSELSCTSHMRLDLAACKALDLTTRNACALLRLLDQCQTAPGSRKLQLWLHQPLLDIGAINCRLDSVQYFTERDELRVSLRSKLRKLPDLDKLGVKTDRYLRHQRTTFELSDCIKLHSAFKVLAEVSGLLGPTGPMYELEVQFGTLIRLIEQGVDLDRFAVSKEYHVHPDFDPELTAISQEIQQVEQRIEDHRGELAGFLGLEKKLKLLASPSYILLFEANKKELDRTLRQGMATSLQIVSHKMNTTTFTTADLKRLASSKQFLQDRYIQQQRGLTDRILTLVASYAPLINRVSDIVSDLDVLSAFAHVGACAPTPYVRPTVSLGGCIALVGCRHPCLETLKTCVENDITIEAGDLQIVTGPNMGGKTTYLRQVAIACIMAQIGCFVPCRPGDNQLPVIDCIVARVGASDHQLKGVSTFMAEMLEVACMLRRVTPQSLVIIDELGRGTSSQDGFGVAWAVCEELLRVGCYTLFATHFTELGRLQHERVKLLHTDVAVSPDSILMLYKVSPGSIDSSYGIQIARMAGYDEATLMVADEKKATEEQELTAELQELLSLPSVSDEDVIRALLTV